MNATVWDWSQPWANWIHSISHFVSPRTSCTHPSLPVAYLFQVIFESKLPIHFSHLPFLQRIMIISLFLTVQLILYWKLCWLKFLELNQVLLLRSLLWNTSYLCKMVEAQCFLHEDYDDVIRTSSHVYTTIALSDTSTCILPCPYNAFSRRYSCVFFFFALLFVACLKYRLIWAQVPGGLECNCFPITKSKSPCSWLCKTKSCP